MANAADMLEAADHICFNIEIPVNPIQRTAFPYYSSALPQRSVLICKLLLDHSLLRDLKSKTKFNLLRIPLLFPIKS